jgi:hypothetical protein
LELAYKWLHQHGAYILGVSDQDPISILECVKEIKSGEVLNAGNGNHAANSDKGKSCNNLVLVERIHGGDASSNDKEQDQNERQGVNSQSKTTFRPMFVHPNPSLVLEFCTFFGLHTDDDAASRAGVKRFPQEQLAIAVRAPGAGGNADWTSTSVLDIETCLDPDVAHTEIGPEHENNDQNIPRRRPFFQLVLVSEEIRSLCTGGAKFSPMESGLSLCSVAIPGPWKRRYLGIQDVNKRPRNDSSTPRVSDEEDLNETSDDYGDRPENGRRAELSGRYGLNDKATELIGYCATRRVVALAKEECLQLLSTSFLEVKPAPDQKTTEDTTTKNRQDPAWWSSWGKNRLQDIGRWEPGAVVVVCARCTSHGSSPVFLSCSLRKLDLLKSGQPRRLDLLTEKRVADCWMRVLLTTP